MGGDKKAYLKGLKPDLRLSASVRAKARTYLKSNCNDKNKYEGEAKITATANAMAGGLIEAATGAITNGFFAFDLAFAHALGVVGGLVVSGFLFGGGEAAFFGAADAFVGVHAFEEKLGCADGGFGFGFCADLEWRELFEESLYLFNSSREPAEGCVSLSCTVPPRLNHCSICCVLVLAKYLSKMTATD